MVHPYIYVHQTDSLNATDGAHLQMVPGLLRIMNSDMRMKNYIRRLQTRNYRSVVPIGNTPLFDSSDAPRTNDSLDA